MSETEFEKNPHNWATLREAADRIKQLEEDLKRLNRCPKCGEAPTYQTPDGTWWDSSAHYWRVGGELRKFATFEDALAAGFKTPMGNGEYSR